MAIGRILFEDWPVITSRSLRLYRSGCGAGECSYDLGIVSDADLSGIDDAGVETGFTPTQVQLMLGFSQLVHRMVYGVEFPVMPFQLHFVVVSDGSIAWDLIGDCVSNSSLPRLIHAQLPDPPFVVTQSMSGQVYRVESVLDESPSNLHIPLDSWGSGRSNPVQQTMALAELYRSKYNIDVSDNQCVLVARMGPPIQPKFVVDTGAAPKPVKKDSNKSSVHLLPELVTLHPITHVQTPLSYIPRYLFWIESGLIANRVVKDLIPVSFATNAYERFQSFFIPSTMRRYSSPITTLAAIALTRPSADMKFSYEKLEWLGDAVWRFLVCMEAVTDPAVKSNFDMLMENSRLGTRVSLKYPNLHTSYILSTQPTLKAPQTCRSRLKNFNILADVVEALLAVAVLSGGIDGAMECAHRMGLFDTDDFEYKSKQRATEAFVRKTAKPAMIRLQASLAMLTEENRNMTIGQLDLARNALLQKDHDVSILGLSDQQINLLTDPVAA